MADANLSAAAEAISAGTTPLRFTDSELQIVSDAVRRLSPQARSAFLHAVAGAGPCRAWSRRRRGRGADGAGVAGGPGKAGVLTMRALRHSELRDDEADETDVNRAGGWSRKQILRMDERFAAAVRQAHPEAKTGEEHQGAKP